MFLGHCYALQLGSHRVWDYKGDNFVHRLLQNKADGKLVPGGRAEDGEGINPPPIIYKFNNYLVCFIYLGERENGGATATGQEKVDSVQLEYTYLLTSQLDSQRRYFEEKLARAESSQQSDIQELKERSAKLENECKMFQAKLQQVTKEKQTAEKKYFINNNNQQKITLFVCRCSQLTQKLSTTQTELNEERQLGKALRNNQQQWQSRVAKLEQRIAEQKAQSDQEIQGLKEQIRDLMFYLDAQNVIAKSENKEDIEGGTISLGTAESVQSEPEPQNSGKKRRSRGKR